MRKARQRVIERDVGHHRRDDRPDADLGVSRRERTHAVAGRERQLQEEVIAGGRSFRGKFGGAEQSHELLVLGRAPAAHPGARRQQQLEWPTVAEALVEEAMAMRMDVDETRDQEALAHVQHLAPLGRKRVRCGDRFDAVLRDQNVGAS